MKPKIVVIGSANTDMIVKADRIPKAGETIIGDSFMQARGGKGANQAVAAARLAAEVTFVACLGKDTFGQDAFEAYKREGINTEYIVWNNDTPSGVALIVTDAEGENIISVAPGANTKLSPEAVLRAERAIQSADCVLLQLEIPMETVEFAVRLASKHRVQVILNPAPMPTTLPDSLLKRVNFLTPNESELTLLMGRDHYHFSEIRHSVNEKFDIETVIVTRGKNGAIISSLQTSVPIEVPPFPIQSVDATGAGDAFNGGLAVALARGAQLEDAVRYANAVGALATTKEGAQFSIPTDGDVNAFLKQFSETNRIG
jgi:ribokinase